MKALITGVAGFIGSHMATRLLGEGHEVIGLDIMLRGSRENIEDLEGQPGFSFYELSILDEPLLETLIRECDVVYHLAAAVGVENIIGDLLKVIDINVEGTRNVASMAHRYGKKVIFTSTSEIYGKSTKVPFREDDDRHLGPTKVDRWVYSSTKALGEYIFIGYARQGLPMSIVRFFNAYGPKLDIEGSGRVISRFIVQALSGQQITVVGDGSQTRCFTYIDDVIDGLALCATIPEAEGETFNIGRDKETSIAELASVVKEITGSDSEIVHIEPRDVYASGYEDIPRRVPDMTKAMTVLGYDPRIDLHEGIRRTVEWFRLRGIA